MGKFRWLIFLSFAFLFVAPMLAHADELDYDAELNGYYWGTNTTTPVYTSSAASFGVDVDVRFKKNSGLDNFGFTAEYTTTPKGPRLTNTGGMFQTTDANGNTGFPISVGGGAFGLVVPGGYQFGGGKLKYFLTPSATNSGLKADVYGDYFSSTGARNAWGIGGELGDNFTKSLFADGFLDYNNVTGNGFPSQTLWRYQARLGYRIGDTNVHAFVGYRGYNYSRFFNTTINGVIAGLGAHW